MGKEFRKLFYGFGALVIVISLLLIRRTVKDVIPTIGFEAAAFYLGMSIVFLVIGVVLLLIARHSGKKEKARLAAEEKDQG